MPVSGSFHTCLGRSHWARETILVELSVVRTRPDEPDPELVEPEPKPVSLLVLVLVHPSCSETSPVLAEKHAAVRISDTGSKSSVPG